MQPPSGGCVLKHNERHRISKLVLWQPPSGGCVLKQDKLAKYEAEEEAATFGWLCVETLLFLLNNYHLFPQPPSGGCVLKQEIKTSLVYLAEQPPSGGCVLKQCFGILSKSLINGSHLRVAVC